MESNRFHRLTHAAGPFVSVYFDDSHDTGDAAAQLDARLRDVRKHLEERSVDSATIEMIEQAVRASHPPVGHSGRAVIACLDGTQSEIMLDEHLLRSPTSTLVRVSELPYLVPVVEHGMLHTSYLTAAVDNTGADITVHGGGSHTESVEETPAHGSPRRVQESIRKNIRDVADRITHLVDESGAQIVFVTGEVKARAELVAALPERVTEKAVELRGGGRTAGTDEAEVHQEMSEEFHRRRIAVIEDAAARFAAGRGTGLAVEGLNDVTAALRDGAVETFIIGEVGDATVVADSDLALVAPSADALSALGGAPARVLRADEALPLLAVATGAKLICAGEGLHPADGIGAVLRYAEMSSAG
jgi:hypothetical protein